MDLGQNADGGMVGGSFSQFGNGMGGASQSSQPVVSSGSSDIIIGEEKRSRKWLVVLVVVLVFVAVGGGVFALWRSGVFGGKVATERGLFNIYANYLLYGENSDSDISSGYVWGYKYYAGRLDVQNGDDYGSYLEELVNKYNNLYDVASEKVGKYYNDVFWAFYNNAMANYVVAEKPVVENTQAYDIEVFSEVWDLKESFYE